MFLHIWSGAAVILYRFKVFEIGWPETYSLVKNNFIFIQTKHQFTNILLETHAFMSVHYKNVPPSLHSSNACLPQFNTRQVFLISFE